MSTGIILFAVVLAVAGMAHAVFGNYSSDVGETLFMVCAAQSLVLVYGLWKLIEDSSELELRKMIARDL